jgi:hypothetical protein
MGSLLGPAQAAAGALTGAFIALAAAVIVQALTTPDPAGLSEAGRHREATTEGRSGQHPVNEASRLYGLIRGVAHFVGRG